MNIRLLACAALLSAFPSLVRAEDTETRVKEILDRWQAATEANCYYYAEGHRYVYDAVFEVETRGRFRTASDFTGRMLLRLEPDEIEPGAASKRVGKNGKPFAVRTDLSEILLFDEHVITDFLPKQRVAIRYPKPQESATSKHVFDFAAIFWGNRDRFEFLAGRSPRTFINSHRFKLVDETPESVHLQSSPKQESSSNDDESQIELILDRRTYRLKAVKFWDITGNCETVYVYEHTKVNQPSDERDSPFAIDWDAYRIPGRVSISRSTR